MSPLDPPDMMRLVNDMVSRVENAERVASALGDKVAAQTRSLEALEKTVAARNGAAKAKIDPATVKPWAETADAAAWATLAEWVDWLVTTYATRPGIPPCWPAHGGLVEELAALHSWWISARHETSKGPSEALGYWHDRGLAPLLNRLSTTYKIASCETTGHKPPVKAQTTNPQLLVQAINGSQVPDADPVTGEVRVDS